MQQHPSIIAGPLLALLLLFSCSSGEEILKEEIPSVQPEEKIAVSFSGRIDLVETKAGNEGAPETPGEAATTQALRKDVNVTIRAYMQPSISQPAIAPQDCRDYLAAGGEGLAVKNGEEEMFLTAGIYTFYALSVNAAGTATDSVPPALATGSHSETEALKNNTDYLYCAVSQKIISDPDGEKQNVNLSFIRLASRIKITVTSKGGTGSEEIIKADAPKITLPLANPAGSKITLGANDPIGQYSVATNTADGDITGYTTLESTGNLTDGFTAGCILLPMQAGQKIPIRIVFPSITFNGLAAQTDKLYTADVTTPTGGFASGKQYNYTVNITGNQVGFSQLTVTPWTSKDGEFPKDSVEEDY